MSWSGREARGEPGGGQAVEDTGHEAQVAGWLQEHLAPRGVGVVIEAEHLCMSVRGVRATGARTVTSALQGLLREDARSRQEFFALTGVHG